MEEQLQRLGMTRNEAKVYLALLDLGPSPVTEIAKSSKLHRTNIYDTLEHLQKKGFVSYLNEGKTRLYLSVNPEALVAHAKETEDIIASIIPDLKVRHKFSSNKTNVEVYEGLQAFRHLKYKLLDLKKELDIFGIPKIAPEKLGFFLHIWHEKRIKQKTLMKHIYNYDAQDRIRELNKFKYTENRYLPAQFSSNVDTTICGDFVIFTFWLPSDVKCIVIEDPEIAKSYKNYFDLIWKQSKTVGD